MRKWRQKHLWKFIALISACIVFVFVFLWIIPVGGDTAGEKKKQNGRTADWSSRGKIRITEPVYGAKTGKNPISAKGKAPKGAIVGLYLNGKLTALTLAKNRKFSFRDIELPRRSNILQARYFDQYGNSYYSKAVAVYYRGSDYREPKIIKKAEKKAEKTRPAPNNITSGSKSGNRIFLTFDGGSTDNNAREVLNTLEEYGINTTFFLTGEFIEKYPELTKRIVRDGHEVGNHTYDHPHLTTYAANYRHNILSGVDKKFLQKQLRKTEKLFKELTGKEMKPLWRAPFGEHNGEIRKWAQQQGYTHIGWTTDSLDWVADKSVDIYHTPGEIRKRVLKLARKKNKSAGGQIILMHLATEREPQNQAVNIIPSVIEELRNKGYRFAKVSDLIGEGESTG